MNLTDPVADFLTRIRNAHNARHQKLDVPASRLKAEVARILKEEGYICECKARGRRGAGSLLRVYLKYGANNEACYPRPEARFQARVPCVRRQG